MHVNSINHIYYYHRSRTIVATGVEGVEIFIINDASIEIYDAIVANLYDGVNSSMASHDNDAPIQLDTYPERFGFGA